MPQDNPNGDSGLSGSTPKEDLEGSVSLGGDQAGDKTTETTKTR
jgi:hypothetical protein